MSSPVTTPLTYNLYVQQIADLSVVVTQTVGGVVSGVDDSFNTLIPQMLNYSELRISRDLDLYPSQTSLNYTMTPSVNLLQISVNDFVTIQTITVNSGGVDTPLLPVSKEFLQNVYGSATNAGAPAYFCMYGGDQASGGNTFNNIIVGPYPDTNYPVTVVGTIRLPSLNANNTAPLAATATTFISTNLPDLLIMASMIYVSAFQRNFSANSNDPQMPGSYEAQYQNLLKGAIVEEARKKFAASAWSSMSPPFIVTPTR